MTVGSDNVFPKVILDAQTSDPSAPTNDNWKLFSRVSGVYARSSNTTVGPLGAGVEFDYVEKTSNTSITATTEGTANTVVTGSSVTYDGSTPVLIEFYAPFGRPDASVDAILNLYLYDGSSSIGRIAAIQAVAARNQFMPIRVARRITPSAAAHTYSIRGAVTTGTGTVNAGAGGNGADMPAFIRITKV